MIPNRFLNTFKEIIRNKNICAITHFCLIGEKCYCPGYFSVNACTALTQESVMTVRGCTELD